jgi:hypothetical protein
MAQINCASDAAQALPAARAGDAAEIRTPTKTPRNMFSN